MKAVEFEGQTIIIAKDQPPYLPVPAHVDTTDPTVRLTFCWQLTWRERLTVLFKGKVWHQMLTFGHSLQPQKLMVDKPELREEYATQSVPDAYNERLN